MAVSATTHLITRAHTAVHLSNALFGAIVEILTHMGISASDLVRSWNTSYDPALRAWINEGSLSVVVVECHQPGGKVEPIFEFPIEYSSDGSAELSHRHVALARHWVKLNRVPSGTWFTIICQYNGWHSDQDGWSAATRASTAGLRSVTLGTLAAGPYASASVRYFTS